MWTVYRITDTIGGLPLTYGQQSIVSSSKITQDRTKEVEHGNIQSVFTIE
jgi:hypothetical protein